MPTTPEPAPPFSLPSLLLFDSLLSQVTLPAGHDHLVEAAQQVVTARTELQAALRAVPEPKENP